MAKQFDQRKKALLATRAASQQDVDTAKAAAEMADARVVANQKALDLAVLGPRKEYIYITGSFFYQDRFKCYLHILTLFNGLAYEP
jgi:hypothetical protein